MTTLSSRRNRDRFAWAECGSVTLSFDDVGKLNVTERLPGLADDDLRRGTDSIYRCRPDGVSTSENVESAGCGPKNRL